MGFISYKILLQSFQQLVIPEMFGALLPYFLIFAQDVELSGLITLQSQLSLDPTQNTQQENVPYKFTIFSANLFKLLEEIVSFKYNITHNEYDELEQTKVTFPENITINLIKSNFLEALYSVITRLLEIKN